MLPPRVDTWLFRLATACCAFLLFAVQPLIARVLFPALGGSPAVWTVSLAFFQAALLAGYVVAALLVRIPRPIGQLVATTLLALAATQLLPWALDPATLDPPSTQVSPQLWLLAWITRTIGLPFVVLASASPLLQAWYVRAGRDDSTTAAPPPGGPGGESAEAPADAAQPRVLASPHSSTEGVPQAPRPPGSLVERTVPDPYPLYAWSNAGSLVALLAYPILIEPSTTLPEQAQAWNSGFLAAVLLLLACGLLGLGRPRAAARGSAGRDSGAGWHGDRARIPVAQRDPSPAEETKASIHLTRVPDDPPREANPSSLVRPSAFRFAGWTLLAFVPVCLLHGVTSHVTTDLAAVPLLWAIPLALYLVSFILTFRDHATPLVTLAQRALPWLVLALLPSLAGGLVQLAWIPLHWLTFLAAAIACHSRLYRARPAPRHLTLYYLAIALGGALAGQFNALAAPVLFSRIVEYPLAIVLACLLLPGTGRQPRLRSVILLPLVVAASATAVVRVPFLRPETPVGGLLIVLACGLTMLALLRAPRQPARYALTLGAVLLACGLADGVEGRVVSRSRSFFGVLRVTHIPADRAFRLFHGTTLHGEQRRDGPLRDQPLSYYTREGPIGDIFRALDQRAVPRSIAVVGLGSGTLAAYARPGDAWTFLELDPAVTRIARDPRYFTYLADSSASALTILHGDARRTLASLPDHSLDLLVLDAFSSDATPVHLLTVEAMRLYARKLEPGGLLALNASTRYLDLESVVAALAPTAGLQARVRRHVSVSPEQRRAGMQPSLWIALTRDPRSFGPPLSPPEWRPLAPPPGAIPWTDARVAFIQHLRLRPD